MVEIDGAPWFVAVDVCKALDMPLGGAASRYLKRLDKNEKQLFTVELVNGKRDAILFPGTPIAV